LILAKLNGATWQSARVEEARFGKNLGLSEEGKQVARVTKERYPYPIAF
jgi:hypothetical protein